MMKYSTYQLSLLVTEKCNLRCSYCYCDKGRKGVMDIGTAKNSIDVVMNTIGNDRLNLLLMGGEPFLAFDRVKEIVDYVREKYSKCNVTIKTVTNGTLVHGDVQRWMEANKDLFFASLSVDGDRDSHNKNRCNSFDNIDFDFFTHLYGNRSEASMVVSPNNLKQLAHNVTVVEDMGFNVKCVLADDCLWDMGQDVELLTEQLTSLMNHYLSNQERMPFTMLREPLQNIGNTHSEKCRPWENVICIDMDGKRWGCHRCTPFYNNGTWKITHDLIGLDGRNLLKKCNKCSVVSVCCTCPALVASLCNKQELAETMCALFKVVHMANAVFVARLFLESPNHVYLRNKNANELQKMINGAQIIIKTMKI